MVLFQAEQTFDEQKQKLDMTSIHSNDHMTLLMQFLTKTLGQ